MIISVSHLSKYYQVYKKEPGLWRSVSSFFARKYETIKAVEDISFSITEGELVGFIGPNGAGKTTTLKCLSGLLYPTHGSISVLGFTPYERKYAYLKQMSLVMGQKNQLWWDLPVIESIELYKEIYNVSDNEYKKSLLELTELLEVKDLLRVQVKKLSLGERMKCELLAALIHRPKVLFLDEPTIGLDVVMQKKLREFIKEYNKRYKATIMLTSHYMRDVEALCKRVIIINHGKMLYDGELLELIKKHAPYKLIKVILKESINIKRIEQLGEVLHFSYPEFILRVDHKKMGQAATKILEEFPVEDVTIEDPDMEYVIRGMFTK
ncbi:MAG: ATP-binding cassette domain-containing protein [Candidatus Levyibacteriota bacterium]|nr:MAG: ATP-binding cassette domain-containing protein [Candidatus Levybacteria bacterium]